MADLGLVTNAFIDGEEVIQWRIPIHVFLLPKVIELKIKAIYEDEGHLCIDVEEQSEV